PQPELLGNRRQREQRARVAHRQPPAAQVALDLLGQPQKSEAVRDRGTILPDSLRQLLLSPVELRQELLVGLRCFDRIQVLTQKILDQRELDALRVGPSANDGGDPIQARLASRPPAALAGDELIGSTDSPDNDRL